MPLTLLPLSLFLWSLKTIESIRAPNQEQLPCNNDSDTYIVRADCLQGNKNKLAI